MNAGKTLMLIGLCMISIGVCMKAFVAGVETATENQVKDNSKSFAIDSVNYHPAGKDNTLQVSPYWRCHLKGTNVWVNSSENREVGDSLAMIIKY
jgi:hypothetical protein